MVAENNAQRLETLLKDKSRLPVVNSALHYLMQVLSDDDVTVARQVAVIERYPSLVVRIIGLANSAWSSPAQPVVSLDMACTRLGLKVVRSVCIALAVAEPFDPSRCAAFNYSSYLQSSLMRSEIAARLTNTLSDADLAVARIAGLLSNIGVLWLADSMSDVLGEALQASDGQPDVPVNTILSVDLGMGYETIGSILAEHWGLPDPLRDAIGRQFHAKDIESEPPVIQSTIIAVHIERSLRYQEPMAQAAMPIRQWLDNTLPSFESLYEDLMEVKPSVDELAESLS